LLVEGGLGRREDDDQALLDRGDHAGGHLRGGVAIACTDATPAIELPATAPLVAQGKTNREIRRCLVRYVARQLYRLLEGQPEL